MSSATATAAIANLSVKSASGLDPESFVPFALKERTDYNYNTTLFRFALKDASATPELPVSSCVLTSFKGEDGKDVIRPYTPINQHEKGVLNLLIKVYAQGKMSKHIHELKVGDELLVKGPMKKKPYVPNTLEQLVLIAGGTGLTPMLQLVDQIFSNPADKTKILLLFANSSPKDVLLREKIDAYSKEHADQFRCVYVVDKNEEKVDWIQETGHITRAMLDKYLPKPDLGDKVLIHTCGPPPFMAMLSGDKQPDKTQGPLIGHLKDMGFESSQVNKQ